MDHPTRRASGPRVAPTHLSPGGQAAINRRWAEHKAQRDQWRLQAEVARLMRSVRYCSAPRMPMGTDGNAWVDPVIRAGEQA